MVREGKVPPMGIPDGRTGTVYVSGKRKRCRDNRTGCAENLSVGGSHVAKAKRAKVVSRGTAGNAIEKFSEIHKLPDAAGGASRGAPGGDWTSHGPAGDQRTRNPLFGGSERLGLMRLCRLLARRRGGSTVRVFGVLRVKGGGA